VGYYITFTLKWEPIDKFTKVPNCEHPKPKNAKFCPECGKSIKMVDLSERISNYLADNQDVFYGINEFGESRDAVKWYDYNKNMIKLSEIFPNYLFTMDGEGEESGDIWRHYFLNGKEQKEMAQIKFGECILINKEH
jgi:hypothetical protein